MSPTTAPAEAPIQAQRTKRKALTSAVGSHMLQNGNSKAPKSTYMAALRNAGPIPLMTETYYLVKRQTAHTTKAMTTTNRISNSVAPTPESMPEL